jgi:hypothetical protein
MRVFPPSAVELGSVYIVDDPMLALIARFVGSEPTRGLSQEAFMRRQVEAIQSYLERFPEKEKDLRAIEWIERHAERYRRAWQRNHFTRWLQELRCPDCPLSDVGVIRHCEIHDRWSDLLLRYARDEITSSEYVEKTLTLLSAHKRRLKSPERAAT